MSGKGWFKLHRKITESAIFTDPDLLRLWIFCLAKASHKDTVVMIEKQEVQLVPGQFVTGRFSLHQEFNAGVAPRKKVKDTTLWSWLKRLETFGNIDIKSTSKYSVVTVVKWSDYQETLTTEPQQTDNGLTADSQQTDTNKNEENDKNERKDINPYRVLEENRFPFMTPILKDKVDSLVEDFGIDEFVEAVSEAVIRGKRNIPYVTRILENWRLEGKGKQESQEDRLSFIDEL